jgi:hypothetical protein
MIRLGDDVRAALLRYASRRRADVLDVRHVNVVPIKAGYSRKAIDRLDLTLATERGGEELISVVCKGCSAREVGALRLVNLLRQAPAKPEIISAWSSESQSEDPVQNGFISPFYAGGSLKFGEAIPTPVLATLGQTHARLANRAGGGWTWTLDGDAVDRFYGNALGAVRTSRLFQELTGDSDGWVKRLGRIGESALLQSMAGTLRKTVVHGDMHWENVLRCADGSPVLIDWGNVCFATPMLDLANCVPIGSAEWLFYIGSYRAAGGDIGDGELERAYWWARAITAFMYLPWAVEHSRGAPGLIEQAEFAIARLADVAA